MKDRVRNCLAPFQPVRYSYLNEIVFKVGFCLYHWEVISNSFIYVGGGGRGGGGRGKGEREGAGRRRGGEEGEGRVV